jgi:hypothetical protein
VGGISPDIIRINVDFPEPEGPSKATISPARISKLIGSKIEIF